MFFEIGVLKNFTNFTGKELCGDSNTGSFLWNLWKFLEHLLISFFTEHIRWLLLILFWNYKPFWNTAVLFFRRIALHLFLITIHFWPSPQKLFKLCYRIAPKQLFSNCLVGLLLTSIVEIFKHSERCHCFLQAHLDYVMHTFELPSPKVNNSLRFSMQKKGFSVLSFYCVIVLLIVYMKERG